MKNITDLLRPISLSEFLEGYYEKKVLILNRNNHNYYDSLLDINKLDNYLANHDIQYPSLRMVKDGAEIDGEKYLKDIDYGTSQFKGLIENDKVFQLFSSGATIVIQGLDRSDFELGRFTRGLSKDLPFTFQSNIYITPKGSQGFVSHYDTHDVFVLQISGSKRWSIFDPKCVTLPTKNEKYNSKETDISNLEEKYKFDLQAGDLIYIPRGFVHRAEATEEDSIHITLGVFPEKWYDLIRFIGNESYLLDEIKSTLPLDIENGSYDYSKIKKELNHKIEQLFSSKILDLILEKYDEKNIKRRKSSDYNRFKDLLKLEQITQQTKFKLRSNIVYKLSKSNDFIELRYYYKLIKLPAFTIEMIEEVLSEKIFSAETLDNTIDMQGRMVLIKKFLKEGLIQFAN